MALAILEVSIAAGEVVAVSLAGGLGDEGIGIGVAGGLVQDEAVDAAAAVQGVEQHVVIGEGVSRQAGGVDASIAAVAVGVQNLHPVGKAVSGEAGAGGVHRAGQAALGDGGQLSARLGDGDGHQLAHGLGPAVVVEGAHGAVGAGHLGLGLGGGGGGAGGGRGGGRLAAGHHHAIVSGLAVLGGDHVHDVPVHAQQHRDYVALAELALAGQLIAGGGAADGIGHARHSGGGGGRFAGGEVGEGAGGPVGVHPHGAQAGVVVVHVILLHLALAGQSAVHIDGGGGEGEGERTTVVGHIGTLGVGADHGGIVHLVIFNGIAQGGAVDGAVFGVC